MALLGLEGHCKAMHKYNPGLQRVAPHCPARRSRPRGRGRGAASNRAPNALAVLGLSYA